jgi:outer membrane autotransporter protein
LLKDDLGTLVLTGANSTISGATTVAHGALTVNGSLANSIVTVQNSARLGGTGTVGGINALAGSVIAPGNSIGTLNVAGNVTFNAGSVYEVEANAAGQADKINATGTATLGGGTVKVLAGSGDYAPSTQYVILHADSNVSGTFASVNTNLAFLTPTLGYSAKDVTLTLARNAVTFDNVGITPNQQATGGGIESLGSGHDLWDAVVQMDAASARDSFDQLSGELHASARSALIEDSRFIREAVLERLHAEGAGVWSRALGSWGGIDSNGNAARLERSMLGVFVGADGQASDTWRLGGVAGYSNSAFKARSRASNGDSQSWHLGGYASGQWGATHLSAGAAHAWHTIDTDRTVNVPGFSDRLKAGYNASTTQLFAEIGHRIEGRTLNVEPFVNVAWVNVDSDGFNEKGGDAALHGLGEDSEATFSTLGIGLDKALAKDRGQFQATLGWRHASGDAMPLTTMGFAGSDLFRIAGAPIARNAAVIGLGMDFVHTDRVNVGVSYTGQFGDDLHDHGLRADVRVKF